MSRSVKIIAWIYALVGSASVLQTLYAVLFAGTSRMTPGYLDGVIPLGIAYGLLMLRPWARVVASLLAQLFAVGLALGLILCLAHVAGIVRAAEGTIVRWPVTTLVGIVSLIAFAVWQWRVLENPRTVELFAPEGKKDVS